MKIIQGINQIRRFKRPVVALGVFDGVHKGHRSILKAAVLKAHRIKGTSIALTFWPHPQREESLYSLRHRLRLIGDLKIDVCVVINFNQRFRAISATDFIEDIVLSKIGAEYVFVGRNFRFGRNAKGDIRTLKQLSRIYGFKLKIFNVIKTRHKPISSTYIRTLIKRGGLSAAQKLLTLPVSILGTVIKGSFLGRQLGFPTANINPHHEVIPPQGVYAVRIILENKKFKGICYIGTKPTFKPYHRLAMRVCNKAQITKHIEAHIFNFNKKIYGKDLEIQFIKRIRDEKRFKSAFELVKQVRIDILKTKEILNPALSKFGSAL
jgi:riboflavin kinase/FMN adenylyltransferase